MLLLHGFTEFCYGWREQVPALVDAGYQDLIPDRRGYNLSNGPGSVRAYQIDHLVADAAAVVASTGQLSAHVVGHDWGAAVADQLAEISL